MALTYSERTHTISRVIELIAFIVFMVLNFFRKPGATVKKIAIIEPFQMGDIISLTVLLDPLRERFPQSEIYVLTKKTNSFVLQHDTRVTDTIILDFPWTNHGQKKLGIGSIIGLIRRAWQLRKENYDLGIDCRGDIRSQIMLKLIGCKQLVGYTSYLHSNIRSRGLLLDSKVAEAPHPHRFDWNRYVLTGLDFSPAELFPIPLPIFRGQPTDKPFFSATENTFKLLIHPGSGWEHRQWPMKNWVQLIESLHQFARMEVVMIAGPGEGATLAKIEALVDKNHATFVSTSFGELQSVILESDLFICLDSGPMNLAVAMNKDVLALFGPGDVQTWQPYTPGSRYVRNTKKFPCSPCLQKECVYSGNNCMQAIGVSAVMKEFKRMYQEKHPSYRYQNISGFQR